MLHDVLTELLCLVFIIDHPALARLVIQAGEVIAHLIGLNRQTFLEPELADRSHGAVGVLQGLSEQGLRLFRIAADAVVKRRCIAGHQLLGSCSNAIHPGLIRQAA